MKTYIGIDPGKSGALAVIEENGDIRVHVWPFNSVKYAEVLTHLASVRDEIKCCVEKVGAMLVKALYLCLTSGITLDLLRVCCWVIGFHISWFRLRLGRRSSRSLLIRQNPLKCVRSSFPMSACWPRNVAESLMTEWRRLF